MSGWPKPEKENKIKIGKNKKKAKVYSALLSSFLVTLVSPQMRVRNKEKEGRRGKKSANRKLDKVRGRLLKGGANDGVACACLTCLGRLKHRGLHATNAEMVGDNWGG